MGSQKPGYFHMTLFDSYFPIVRIQPGQFLVSRQAKAGSVSVRVPVNLYLALTFDDEQINALF